MSRVPLTPAKTEYYPPMLFTEEAANISIITYYIKLYALFYIYDNHPTS
jgi:hypothetical protein